MPRIQRQEALMRAYIQAIVAHCGLAYSEPQSDYGIDLTLLEIAYRKRCYAETGFKLDLQLKSTTNPVLTDKQVLYDLDARAYEILRASPVGCPRILVLLTLPETEENWLFQTEEELHLRRCAYWLSLEGQGPTANQRSVRIAIPRENVFSVAALNAMLGRIRKGARL